MSTEDRLDILEGELAALRRRVDRTEAAIERSIPLVAEIRDLLDAGLAGIVARLDRMDAHFETIDGHLVEIDGHLVEVDGRLGRIEQVLRERGTDGHA